MILIFKKANRGFTLTEVLIATIVMSMIMGSVLAFVQYSGEIWHKGNEKVSTQNYSRMAFELLKQDLLQAIKITYPKSLEITRRKIKYQTIDAKTSKIALNSVELSEDNTLIRYKKLNDAAPAVSSEPMRLARNVKYFGVKRISKRTFEIYLQINGAEYEDQDGNIASDTISSESMILIAPGVSE